MSALFSLAYFLACLQSRLPPSAPAQKLIPLDVATQILPTHIFFVEKDARNGVSTDRRLCDARTGRWANMRKQGDCRLDHRTTRLRKSHAQSLKKHLNFARLLFEEHKT